jgi:hypothetical protein
MMLKCEFREFSEESRIWLYVYMMGARGSVVVKALCYKAEGCGFETRRDEFLNLPNLSGRIRPSGSLSL